jgi:hypothetical protein
MNNDIRIEKLNEQIAQIDEAMQNPDLCKGTADTYTRVSGYYRPVKNFNIGKACEYCERKEYVVA